MKVMKWSVIALAVAAGTSQMALASQQSESKGFVEDASLDLLLRNTYFNRDYKDGAPDRRSWKASSLLSSRASLRAPSASASMPTAFWAFA